MHGMFDGLFSDLSFQPLAVVGALCWLAFG